MPYLFASFCNALLIPVWLVPATVVLAYLLISVCDSSVPKSSYHTWVILTGAQK
ncbi:MAG: hypothetical protein ACI4RQ_06725 [Methanobrevibacter wolinii]